MPIVIHSTLKIETTKRRVLTTAESYSLRRTPLS
jgi:hypothetical protein